MNFCAVDMRKNTVIASNLNTAIFLNTYKKTVFLMFR